MSYVARIALFVSLLAPEASAQFANDTATVRFIREIATAARSGPLKLAELRGPPLNDPSTFALQVKVPDAFTCVLLIRERAVVMCRIPAMIADGAAKFDTLARVVQDAIGSRGWRHEPNAERDIVRSGAELARSYSFRRERRMLAVITLTYGSGAAMPPPLGAERVIVMTARALPHPAN
jgi:hypothetical protein